jgi:hypothetical protein
MQLLGTGNPNVLGSSDVLQDGDFLYSVMPFCRGGDLFGVVVQYAEENGGEAGMPEPVARYWFRQILWVSSSRGIDLSLRMHFAYFFYADFFHLTQFIRTIYAT